MADYSVVVVNEGEIDVYDTSSHATLEEIRDLLKPRLAVEYTVICNKFLCDTVAGVNELLKQGWRPVGGIHSTYQTEWAQALCRSSAPTVGTGHADQS